MQTENENFLRRSRKKNGRWELLYTAGEAGQLAETPNGPGPWGPAGDSFPSVQASAEVPAGWRDAPEPGRREGMECRRFGGDQVLNIKAGRGRQ